MATLKVPEVFEPLLRPARFKAAHGGRGSGKSHFFAGYMIARAASEAKFRAVCVREVQRSIADSVKQLLEDKITQLGLETFFTITDQEIRGRNGSLIIFRGLQNHTAASIKSLEGFAVAWVEEAQTISQKSLDILIPTIREPGSQIWFSFNPDDETDPVDKLLRAAPPDGAIVVEANWSDNPFFPEELRADLERDRERDPDKYAHVWCGQYRKASEARVFRNWRIGDIDVPDNIVWFYGVDWGFANDPLAGVRVCFPDERTLYVSDEVYELGVATERIPTVLNALPGIKEWPSTADSARPETIDYAKRHGFPRMRGAVKGKGSVEDGVSFLQGLDIVVSPRCPNVAEEFRRYAYKTDRQTGEILPVLEDAWNHAIDGIRYATERAHRKGKLIVAPTLAKARPRSDYGSRDDSDGGDNWRTV